MHDFRNDPVHKAIYGNIIRAIDLLFENECIIPGVMMVLSGIDIMANLNRPPGKQSSQQDFKDWVRQYIHIPGANGLEPNDLWSARNALIHTYGSTSSAVMARNAKVVTWIPNPHVAVYHNPKLDPNLVRVDPYVFKEAFKTGVRDFLFRAFSDPERRQLMEERLQHLITYSPSVF